MAHLFANVVSNETFLERFQRGGEIGSGAFGKILLVLDNVSLKTVAVVKQVDLTRFHEMAQEYNKQEVSIGHFLSHPRLLTMFYFSFED